jgi:hypothetical protein
MENAYLDTQDAVSEALRLSLKRSSWMGEDSDEAGHAFQFEAGHPVQI